MFIFPTKGSAEWFIECLVELGRKFLTLEMSKKNHVNSAEMCARKKKKGSKKEAKCRAEKNIREKEKTNSIVFLRPKVLRKKGSPFLSKKNLSNGQCVSKCTCGDQFYTHSYTSLPCHLEPLNMQQKKRFLYKKYLSNCIQASLSDAEKVAWRHENYSSFPLALKSVFKRSPVE